MQEDSLVFQIEENLISRTGELYRLLDLPRNRTANTDPDELIRSPNAP